MEIVIRPRRLALTLTAAISLLMIAHGVAQFCIFVLDHDYVYGLVPLFDLAHERNVPTLYSSLTLLLCAALLAIIAHARAKDGRDSVHHWSALAGIFVLLSLDEALMLHEGLAEPVRTAMGTSGPLYFAWIIPYGLAVLSVAVVYLRFLYRLPNMTRRLFLLAAGLYVSGALGMEAIEGVALEQVGSHNLLFVSLYTAEELLEMSGVAVFMYALAAYIATEMQELRLRIGSLQTPADLSFQPARQSTRYTVPTP